MRIEKSKIMIFIINKNRVLSDVVYKFNVILNDKD